jgi:hypothetical protein
MMMMEAEPISKTCIFKPENRIMENVQNMLH